MGRRRTGSAYEKTPGVWWYSFILRSGKRWAKPVPPRPDGKPLDEASATAFKDEALRRYELGVWDPEAPKPAAAPPERVEDFLETWAKGLTHSSAHNEVDAVRRYVKGTELGRKFLADVTSDDVMAWVQDLTTKPGKRVAKLKARTVTGAFGTVSRGFAFARFRRLMTVNVCELPPGILPTAEDNEEVREAWVYTREEITNLISDDRVMHVRRVLYAILFCTGVRINEATPLRWSDWSAREVPLGRLAIVRALKTRTRVLKGTKTNTVRFIPVHPTLAAVLAEWKLSGWQRLMGRTPKDDDLIVPTNIGGIRHDSNVRKQLWYDSLKVGVPRRRLHGTRHTFISLGIDDGARPDIFERLTHPPPTKKAFDKYRHRGTWSSLCAEVMKLDILRRETLPLAAWAQGQTRGSATDSATDSLTTRGNIMQHDVSQEAPEVCPSPDENATPHENAAFHDGAQRTPRAKPASRPPSGADSATAGSAIHVGPLTGEAWAYDWFERVLLEHGEP